jgi:hypothetical protein
MADISLDDSLLTINLSLDQLDTLVESIGKANALTHIILAADMDIVDLSMLHNFLWALDDLIYSAREVCGHLKISPQKPRLAA